MPVVRNSQLRDFGQCPLKEMLGWRLGWGRPEDDERKSDASRGTLWHRVLMQHYSLIRQWQLREGFEVFSRLLSIDAIHQGVSEGVLASLRGSPHYDTLCWMYDGYVEHYGLDAHWEILDVETTRTVPFIEPSGRRSRYRYRWTTDLLARDHELNGAILVVDNKSNKNLLGPSAIDLDDQYGNYTWAERRRGVHVLAQYYNGTRTDRLKRPMVSAERFARVPGHRTDLELREIELDSLRKAKAIHSKANQQMPYSVPDPRVCSWKCEFEAVHLALRKTGMNMDKLPALMRAHGFVQREVPNGARG